MRFFQRRLATSANPEKFLQVLQASRTGQYNRADRYRDFRQVFMGHSDAAQGQRVLSEIFKLGGLYSNTFVPGADPSSTFARAGASDLCKRVMAILNADPEKEEQ